MDNISYLGLRAQQALERRIATTASNLANVNTTGFKADALRFQVAIVPPARSGDRPNDIRFARDAGLVRDFTQGPVSRTGESFDLAIEGDGFFVVQGPNGPAYTRDGSFQLDAAGTLVTSDGRAVLDSGGAPIVFDTRGEAPQIDREGRIRVGAVNIGALQLVSFANQAGLSKIGDNLFEAKGQAPAPFEGVLVQGALEESNVDAVSAITELIQVSRAYEGAARIVQSTDDLRQRALQRLGQST